MVMYTEPVWEDFVIGTLSEDIIIQEVAGALQL